MKVVAQPLVDPSPFVPGVLDEHLVVSDMCGNLHLGRSSVLRFYDKNKDIVDKIVPIVSWGNPPREGRHKPL